MDAKLMLHKENYTGALEKLNAAIRDNEFDYEAYFLRGIAKFTLGDIIGAEQDYTNSIKIYPFLSDAFHYRAVTRERLYNFNGAIADFEKALKLQPGRV